MLQDERIELALDAIELGPDLIQLALVGLRLHLRADLLHASVGDRSADQQGGQGNQGPEIALQPGHDCFLLRCSSTIAFAWSKMPRSFITSSTRGLIPSRA